MEVDNLSNRVNSLVNDRQYFALSEKSAQARWNSVQEIFDYQDYQDVAQSPTATSGTSTPRNLHTNEGTSRVVDVICLLQLIPRKQCFTLQKQTSLEKPPTNPYGTLGRGRKRSNSNPKKSEQPPSPKERTPNFTTFVCINTSDTIFIHQNNTLYIFTPELELVVRERIPETLNPKSMAVDFFGHIFYSTEDNIILC